KLAASPHYYRNLEIKHSQPKNRASGKRVS
ncbi:hypothetical protein, partial [Escherichia coli]